MSQLQQFISDRCFADPNAVVTVQSFSEAFRRTLLPRERAVWTRCMILDSLQRLGFVIGRRGDRRLAIAGLSLDPPRRWAVEAGRLVRRPTGDQAAAAR